MKKWIAWSLAVLMMLLTACTGAEDETPEMTFCGVIYERLGDSVIVEVAEDEEERKTSDLIWFSVTGLTPLDASAGDTVSVSYTGVIMETYPAQVVPTGWKLVSRREDPREEPVVEHTEEESVPVPEPEIPTLGEEPPALVITASEKEYRIRSGNYSWDWPNEDGTMSSVIACGMHPLDYTGEADMVVYAEGEELFFRFDVMPQSVTCRCWTEEYWGDPQSYESNFEVIELGEYTLMPLSNVRYVYELTADWGDGRSASYIFGSICDDVPSAE